MGREVFNKIPDLKFKQGSYITDRIRNLRSALKSGIFDKEEYYYILRN
jgi:hypothetical protein